MTSLSDSLNQAIERWLGRSKYNNLNMLANKLNVSYTTLHRTVTGQVEEPHFRTVMAIIHLIMTAEEGKKFIAEHYPYPLLVSDQGNGYLQNRTEKQDQYERSDIEELFAQRDGYLLGQHLISRCGITEEKIEELYGSHGLCLLRDLENKGQVEFIDGAWRMPTKGAFVSDNLDSNLRQIGFSASTFKDDSAQVHAGYVRNLSEGVTLEAAQMIRLELDAVAARIDRIAEQNPGKHVFTASVMTQLLDPKEAIAEAVTRAATKESGE